MRRLYRGFIAKGMIKMDNFLLKTMDLDEAKKMQFKIVDCITRYFRGNETLNLGDLGMNTNIGKPVTTSKVEKIIADIFEAEASVLVRGAGTGAIRWALYSIIKPNGKLLVHDASVFSTTAISIDSMGLKTIKADFNAISNIEKQITDIDIDGVLIQHTRQKLDDAYSVADVINIMKNSKPDVPVLVDDNYAAMRVENIGVQLGADLSAFSCFKLLGPEGIGCVVGKEKYIRKIVQANISGGSQVQGYEAMEVLRGLTYAPVSIAIQSEVIDELVERLNNGEIKEVKRAFCANAQSKVLIVEFHKPIVEKFLLAAEKFGATNIPVGSESKYEIVPMFYRISRAFKENYPDLYNTMARVYPMRSGPETVIKILRNAIESINNF